MYKSIEAMHGYSEPQLQPTNLQSLWGFIITEYDCITPIYVKLEVAFGGIDLLSGQYYTKQHLAPHASSCCHTQDHRRVTANTYHKKKLEINSTQYNHMMYGH